MKVILSRKGFDSGFGNCPSPILPGGRLVSLPIPRSDPNTYENSLSYSDLKFDENLSYYDLIKQLKPDLKIKLKHDGRIRTETITKKSKRKKGVGF